MKEWERRRRLSYKLYAGLFDDVNLPYEIQNTNDDDALYHQVLYFFEHQSELIYPAKFIFCNIVYSYYLNKYFGEDFYESLDNKDLLADSPMILLYGDNKPLYDSILKEVMDRIETLPSVVKTRHYFKMEFLINDEDISDVLKARFI